MAGVLGVGPEGDGEVAAPVVHVHLGVIVAAVEGVAVAEQALLPTAAVVAVEQGQVRRADRVRNGGAVALVEGPVVHQSRRSSRRADATCEGAGWHHLLGLVGAFP